MLEIMQSCVLLSSLSLCPTQCRPSGGGRLPASTVRSLSQAVLVTRVQRVCHHRGFEP